MSHTLRDLRLPGLGGWGEDPLWAGFYDWTVEHPHLGGALWRLGLGSDLGRLYDATGEIGRLPDGSTVLDVPCGGGVALRGLRAGQSIRYVAADIDATMLGRTIAAGRARGVEEQVETVLADVAEMPFTTGEFDLVASFTGLHCFPDPRGAVLEMTRVLRTGGVLTGSALLNDTGLRYEHIRRVGRVAGLLGPGATRDELRGWLTPDFDDVQIRTSGAMVYFRAVRSGTNR